MEIYTTWSSLRLPYCKLPARRNWRSIAVLFSRSLRWSLRSRPFLQSPLITEWISLRQRTITMQRQRIVNGHKHYSLGNFGSLWLCLQLDSPLRRWNLTAENTICSEGNTHSNCAAAEQKINGRTKPSIRSTDRKANYTIDIKKKAFIDPPVCYHWLLTNLYFCGQSTNQYNRLCDIISKRCKVLH